MATKKTAFNITLKHVSTQNKTALHPSRIDIKDLNRGKRKADSSPAKENKCNTKRPALRERHVFADRSINVSNVTKVRGQDDKKIAAERKIVQIKTLASVKTVVRPPKQQNENLAPPRPQGNKITTRSTGKNVIPNQTAQKPKEPLKENNANKVNKRLSNEFEKTEDTLYCTALEEIAKKQHNLRSSKGSSVEPSPCNLETTQSEEKCSDMSIVARQIETKLNLGNHNVPHGIEDFDQENWDDIFQVSHYAKDIFHYLKDKELEYEINDYMDRQICLTRWMRSLLIDWMVEIQESFELNHETLYLGVKLVDMYLSRMTVGKETLQLVGAAAMFIASKYDERIPPRVDDFLYICDGAYKQSELIRMEINLLKVCDFNLGIPISYRFLRRYARCAKVTMPVLTLARFILEFSLMDYSTVTIRDSKLASAALYLALKMKKISEWTPTLEYYTGYKLEDFKDVVIILNEGLQKPAKNQLMTVRNKYSHKIFFQVAKTPLLSHDEL